MYNRGILEKALNSATQLINKRSKQSSNYTRGYNDCFALLVAYDAFLRKGNSKCKYIKDLEYNSPVEFLKELKRRGYTLEEFANYCGYEIVTNKRPMFGDIAYEHGSAMIASDGWWVSTSECNEGVSNKRQINFIERRLILLARPIRS
jgi:hypothetical protein